MYNVQLYTSTCRDRLGTTLYEPHHVRRITLFADDPNLITLTTSLYMRVQECPEQSCIAIQMRRNSTSNPRYFVEPFLTFWGSALVASRSLRLTTRCTFVRPGPRLPLWFLPCNIVTLPPVRVQPCQAKRYETKNEKNIAEVGV